MSLQVAVFESAREVLRETLAPDLADKLAQRVVERASSRIDEAIGEFLGLDLARDGGAKRRQPKPRNGARGKATGLEDDAESFSEAPEEGGAAVTEAAA